MLLAELIAAYIALVTYGGGILMHYIKFINYPNSINGPIVPNDPENRIELKRVA